MRTILQSLPLMASFSMLSTLNIGQIQNTFAQKIELDKARSCFCHFETPIHPTSDFCSQQCQNFAPSEQNYHQKNIIQALIPVNFNPESSTAANSFIAQDLPTFMSSLNIAGYQNDIKVKIEFNFKNESHKHNVPFFLNFHLISEGKLIYLPIPANLPGHNFSLSLFNTITGTAWPEISFHLPNLQLDDPLSIQNLITLNSKYSAHWNTLPEPKLLDNYSKSYFTDDFNPIENTHYQSKNNQMITTSHDIGWRPDRNSASDPKLFINAFPKLTKIIDSKSPLHNKKFSLFLFPNENDLLKLKILDQLEAPWSGSSPENSFTTLYLPISYHFAPQSMDTELNRAMSNEKLIPMANQYPMGSLVKTYKGECPKTSLTLRLKLKEDEPSTNSVALFRWKKTYKAIPVHNVASTEILFAQDLRGKVYIKNKNNQKRFLHNDQQLIENDKSPNLMISMANMEYRLTLVGCTISGP